MHICLVCPSTLVCLLFQRVGTNCLFRVEKRVCGLTLLERGIHAYLFVYMHICLYEHARLFRVVYFFSLSRTDFSMRRVDCCCDESSRTGRVVTIRRLISPPLDLQC